MVGEATGGAVSVSSGGGGKVTLASVSTGVALPVGGWLHPISAMNKSDRKMNRRKVFTIYDLRLDGLMMSFLKTQKCTGAEFPSRVTQRRLVFGLPFPVTHQSIVGEIQICSHRTEP